MVIKHLKNTFCLLHGLLILTIFFSLIIFFIPVYIYRWCITMWTKHFYKGKIGKPVTARGNFFATEFLPSDPIRPPRCSIVSTWILDGKVSVEELQKLIREKWISPTGGVSRYPEFMQYVESWMGFMFWKQDLDFNLSNHTQYHNLVGETDEEVEDNLCLFVEDLLNKAFQPKRSPWELYVINDYKNKHLQKQCVNEEMTLIVFRFYHCLADGYSILYAIMEGLLGMPLSSISLPLPTELRVTSLRKKILSSLSFPFRFLYETSEFVRLRYSPKTRLHVPDDNTFWRQSYVRSPQIPIERIKNIKNRLGVSFTGVLLSAVAGGLAKIINVSEKQELKHKDSRRTIPFLTMLPLPGHPNKLRNHITSTYLKLPTGTDIGSYERLQNVEIMLKEARQTTFPTTLHFISKAFGSLLATTVKSFTKNRSFPAGLTNFPGPGVDIYFISKRVIGADFVAGLCPGICGVGFMLLSYGNHVQFAMSLEQSVMSRKEAKNIMEDICDEIEILNELSKNYVSEKTELLPV